MLRLSKSGNTLKRVVSAFLGVTTVLSLSGVALIASAVAPADYGLKEGDVISAAGSDDPDVYIVNEHGFKRLFLNPAIFGFYGHLGGFAAVKSVSPSTRDAFGTSGLFRNCETNDPKVYGVETTGEDVGMLHWVNTSGAQAVADDANFFKKVFCINNNEFNWYSKGSDYTSVNQVPNYSRQPSQSSGPISAGLAATNPASGTLVSGATDSVSQAAADLAHFQFTGNGTVTNLKLKRIGVSADATLDNVYLYDGSKRITDSATVSNGEISFNDAGGLFTVSGSRVISVRADIDASTSGQTVGVQLSSINGTAVNVSGNLHTIASATLATVTLSATTTPSTNSALDPADDTPVWQNTVTVGTRYVWLKSMQFRMVGSVSVGDLQNFRLFVDGVQVGSSVAQTDSNGYIVFDLMNSPVKLETGSRTLKILANVVNGSSRTFTSSLRQASDIVTTDSQYNAGVRATAAGSFPVSAGEQTISTGTLTITKKTDSPSGDVVLDASGVVLARFEFKANGERMKIENLRLSLTHSNGGSTVGTNVTELRNGALFADGVQIGSTQDINEDSNTSTYTEYSLGSSLIVNPGTPRIVEIRGDVTDGDSTDDMEADDTMTLNIAAGSSNVQRMTSLGYTANSAASGNQLTVKTGSFTAGKYTGYADQSVVAPKTGVKIGHYTLAAASSEDINVNTLTFDAVTASGSLTSDFTDAYVKVMNDSGTTIYTSPAKATFSATASNSYSVNFTIPKNKTYQVELWANVASTFEPDTEGQDIARTNFDASGVTASSGTSATATQVTGQTLTSASGSLTTAAGSNPAARLAAGGTTATGLSFSFTPTYDDFTIDEIYVDLSSTTASSTGAVANLYLKDGSTTLSSTTVNSSTGSASFTGLNLSLPQSGGQKTYTVDVQLAGVGVGANDTGGNVTLRLDGMKYRNSAGSITTTNGLAAATYGANANLVHKAYPTVTAASLPSTVLSAGSQTLSKQVIGASGGNIGLHQIVFKLTRSTSGPTIQNSTFQVFEDGVNITSLGTVATATGNFNLAVDASTDVSFRFTNERTISTSKTYELRGTVGGTLTAGFFITTRISGNSTSAITDDAATVRSTLSATTPSLVWTDQSAPSHSTSTDDWMNDYLVQSLNVSQTLQVP